MSTIVKHIFYRYELTLRITFLILMTGLSFAFLMATSRAALAMGLKTSSVVTGESILLGDVFYGLPHSADKVLGPAPQPGTEMVLNARTLHRIAMKMDLPWRPSNADRITLISASTAVSQDDIEAALEERLKDKGVTGLFNVYFSGAMPTITLPQSEPATFEIGGLTYNEQDKRFAATLFAPSLAKPIQKVVVSGRVEPMTEIPVLSAPLRAGDIIGAQDIEFIKIPTRELGAKTALKELDLIGSTPRRMLEAGKPVQMTEVQPPRLVTRGDIVTMVFHEGTLTLTAKGRALEHGAKGDTIRVVNSNSSRTIEGTVSGDKEITLHAY